MKVLKFGAVWCPGCLIMKPRWKEIESENPWIKTQYFDFDSNKTEVEKYKVNDGLPVFIFLDKEDKEIHRISGEVEKEKILLLLNQYKDR